MLRGPSCRVPQAHEARIMLSRQLLALSGFLFLSGCLYHARERADDLVCTLAARPFDLQPPTVETKTTVPGSSPAPAKQAGTLPAAVLDVQTTAYMQAENEPVQLPASKPRLEPNVPPEIPGSEARPIQPPAAKEAKQ